MLRKQWNSYVIARQRVIARPLMIISYYSPPSPLPTLPRLLFISEAGSQGRWRRKYIIDGVRSEAQSGAIFSYAFKGIIWQTDMCFKNTHLVDKLDRERWKYCPRRVPGITLFIHARNLSPTYRGIRFDYIRGQPFWICVVSEKPIRESEFNWWVSFDRSFNIFQYENRSLRGWSVYIYIYVYRGARE